MYWLHSAGSEGGQKKIAGKMCSYWYNFQPFRLVCTALFTKLVKQSTFQSPLNLL
jgi:hypothetical protein